jgi:tRNA threonylcarbamoyladenosine biosynthesis protein TsaE
MTKYKRICKTLEDTAKLAQEFSKLVENNGVFICLYGEIGAGKTAFVKKLAEALGVTERVTSPSFVILNEYHSAKLPLYHFDLYRLENVGISTIEDELREYTTGKKITLVEWAEFDAGALPFDRVEINVTYDDDDTRCYEFSCIGETYKSIIEELNSVNA